MKGKIVSDRIYFPLRDSPREACEDAIMWVRVNLPNQKQVECRGVNIANDEDFFDEDRFNWTTLDGSVAKDTMSHVRAFTVKNKEVIAIMEDGEEVPLAQVGGLLTCYRGFLKPISEFDAWYKAAILAEDHDRALLTTQLQENVL